MTNSRNSKKWLNRIFYFNGLNSIRRASKKKSVKGTNNQSLKKYFNILTVIFKKSFPVRVFFERLKKNIFILTPKEYAGGKRFNRHK